MKVVEEMRSPLLTDGSDNRNEGNLNRESVPTQSPPCLHVTTRREPNGESLKLASSTLISSTKGIKHLPLQLQLQLHQTLRKRKWKTSIITGALPMPILDLHVALRIFSGESSASLIPALLRVAFQLPRFSSISLSHSVFTFFPFQISLINHRQLTNIFIVTSNLYNTILFMECKVKNLFGQSTAICRYHVL